MRKAVLIGAGQIGRGFIGHVLHQCCYELVFIDVSKELVDEINRQKGYKVIVLGAEESSYFIDGIRAYMSFEDSAVEEMVEADLVTTAVGPGVLYKTAGYIAKGIIKRQKTGIKKPLTIIACENMEFGSTKLLQKVEFLLNDEQLKYCRQFVTFPDAVVSRMVLPADSENPLTVKVEQYMEWIVDEKNLKSDLSHITPLETTDDPTAYIRRKMYTLTGHAMLGYMGYAKGYHFICQAAYDDNIFKTVFKALLESGKGWSREYGKSEESFLEYITVMLRRFSDTRLQDSCIRICRDPIRKLSLHERFIGPALIALKHKIEPVGIIEGINWALRYDHKEDEEAVKLGTMLREKGLETVLKQISGLNENEELYQRIIERRNI